MTPDEESIKGLIALRPEVCTRLRRRIPLALVTRREGDLVPLIDRHVIETLGLWLETRLALLEEGQIELFVDDVVRKILDEQREHARWERRTAQAEFIEDDHADPTSPRPDDEPEPERPPVPRAWLAAARRVLKKNKRPTLKNLAAELGVSATYLRRLRQQRSLTKPQRHRARRLAR